MGSTVRLAASLVALSASACFSSGVAVPPAGSPPAAYVGCTTSRAAPITDLTIGGLGVAATAGLIYWQAASKTDGGGPVVAVILTVPVALAGTISGGRGMAKVARCRRGLARYRDQGAPGTTSPG